MYHSILDFYSRDASSPPSPVVTAKNVFRHSQMSPGGQSHPWLRTTALNGKSMRQIKPNGCVHMSTMLVMLSLPAASENVKKEKAYDQQMMILWPEALAYYWEKKKREILFTLLVTAEMQKPYSNARLTVFRICGAVRTLMRKIQMPNGLWLENGIKEACSLPALGCLLWTVSRRRILKMLLNMY